MKALIVCVALAGAVGLSACADTYGYDGYGPGYYDQGYGYNYRSGDYYRDGGYYRDRDHRRDRSYDDPDK